MKPETRQKIYKWGFYIQLPLTILIAFAFLAGVYGVEPEPVYSKADYEAAFVNYNKTLDTLRTVTEYYTGVIGETRVLYLDSINQYTILKDHSGDLVDYPGFCQKMRLLLPVYIRHLKDYRDLTQNLPATDPTIFIFDLTDQRDSLRTTSDAITTTEALLKEYERC